MRSLTTGLQAESEKKFGSEPSIILEVQWGSLGTLYFGEKTFSEGEILAEGRIQTMTGIRATVNAEQLGTVATVTVSMLDNDELMLDRMTTVPLQGQVVRILRAFVGTGEQIEMFRGRAAGPVVWNEDHQTFEFDIVTRLPDEIIPYTPEEDDFSALTEDAAGATWPMCFGTPKDVPATRISYPAEAVLDEDVLEDSIDFKIDVQFGEFTEGVLITLNVGGEHMTGILDGKTFTITERNVEHYTINSATNNGLSDAEKVDPRFAIWALTDEALVGKYVVLSSLGETYGLVNKCLYQRGGITRHQHPWFFDRPDDIGFQAKVYGVHPDSVAWTLPAGTPVYEVGQVSKYVANELPSTEIHTVKAYRTVNGYRSLARVPPEWFTVNLSAAGLGVPGGRTPTTITFDEPLSSRGTGWSDEIYVSLTSSVSDNTSDAIKYIVDTYSDATSKASAFAAVKTALENYPSNFYINTPRSALEYAADIAFQARCGLFETGTEISIVYLSAEPTEDDVSIGLGDDNVKEAMIQLSESESDEAVTRLVAFWRDRGSEEERNQIVYERNVDLYGRNDREIDFYIYAVKKLVKKSALFWSYRLGNLWRFVRLTTFMNALGIELLDYVELNCTGLRLPSQLITAVNEIEDNSEVNNITLLLWTPVLAGTQTKSSIAYLDDSGDTKPDDPTFRPDSDVAEVEEGSTFTEPIDQASRETFVAKATANEVDGVFDADIYEGTEATGTPTGSATVRNVGPTAVAKDDVLPVHSTEDGLRYGYQGAGASAYWCECTSEQPDGFINFVADIYATNSEDVFEEDATVINLGDGKVEVGDTLGCWKLSDGEYIAQKFASGGGSAARAVIGTKVGGRVYNATIDGNTEQIDIVNAPTGDTVPSGTALLAQQDADGNWYGQVPVWL